MLLVAGPGMARRNLGTRASFADVASSWAKAFGLGWAGPGTSVF
jgi:phosphopentomutase